MKRYLYIFCFLLICNLITTAQNVSLFADKPCVSYSGYNDESGKPAVLLWGKAPLTDFGSREVKFNQTGIRTLRQVPPAGVHPRIFFGPQDLGDVRKRIKESRTGQEAWKNILSWTEMMKGNYDEKASYAQPDRWNGGFGGLHGRVPLFRLGVPRENGIAYNHHPKATAIYQALINGTATEFPDYYWNAMALEAFRCLIENDKNGAEAVSKATITAMKIDQTKRDTDTKLAGKIPEQPVGRFQLAFIYDFAFNWMTTEQKQAIHDEIALGTWSHDNYGTFNTAESSRSNWATFSYWLYEVLAIEGEQGFNELKVRGMYRGWRNLMTYGWFQSGATYEGEAKNQLGMDGILLFSTREKAYNFENLCGHPYLQAYATKFLPHSINPMQNGFNKYDLLGGSRLGSGGFTPCDMLGLKYMFPNDKTIDWVFRKTIGENYENVPERPDGYYNGLLFFAIYATDFEPANNDVTKLSLGNTFFCGERALMMTRSSWDKDATMLNMHTRAANGGHAFSDRNAIMVAGAGRIWSPNGYANFFTAENSVVCIDGKNQSLNSPGRVVDFKDNTNATFVTGDTKYCWDWSLQTLNKKRGYYTIDDVKAGKVEVPAGFEPVKQSTNDFAFTKLPFSYLNKPLFESSHWILPSGALSPVVRKVNYPLTKAFRTAGLIRGAQPYILVIDDIQKDSAVHHYDWTLGLEKDIQIAKIDKKNDREMDIILTGFDPDQKQKTSSEAVPSLVEAGKSIPAGQPMLLIRVLNCSNSGKDGINPQIVEMANMTNSKNYQSIRRLIISSDAVSPDYKVLIVPYKQGAALPKTNWNAKRNEVTVSWANQKDVITFKIGNLGKTNVAVTRDANSLISMDKAIMPLE